MCLIIYNVSIDADIFINHFTRKNLVGVSKSGEKRRVVPYKPSSRVRLIGPYIILIEV
jgi:hypothetical protein